MGLCVLFLILTVKNSWGNVSEVISMLDEDKYTGLEIEENYKELVEKWGEWTVVGDSGGVMKVEFIDIRNALFSGLMITYLSLTLTCFSIAIIFGKIVFPKLAQLYSENNQDMVNIATLQTHEAVKRNKKEKQEDWF